MFFGWIFVYYLHFLKANDSGKKEPPLFQKRQLLVICQMPVKSYQEPV